MSLLWCILVTVLLCCRGFTVPFTESDTNSSIPMLVRSPYQHRIGSFNIIFIKDSKVGGSTVGGVVRRIADHYNITSIFHDKFKEVEPGIWAVHDTLGTLRKQLDTLQLPVYLMTWVRDPAERAMSEYYHFHVTRVGEIPTAMHKKQFLLNMHPNWQMSVTASYDFKESVTKYIHDYDFIGVTERFEESMLLLALHLNLTMCDILYLKAKDSHGGGVDDKHFKFVPHKDIHQEPSEVRKYLQHGFRNKNSLDYELVDAVNALLNESIAALPSDNFVHALRVYHKYLDSAAKHCPGEKFKGNCYWNDNGCGYPCLDQMCRDSSDVLNIQIAEGIHSNFYSPW